MANSMAQENNKQKRQLSATGTWTAFSTETGDTR